MTELSAPATPSRPAFPKPSAASQRLLHTRLTPSPRSSPTRPQHPPKPPETRPVGPVCLPKELTRLTAPTTPRRARTSDESVEAMLPSPSGFIYVQASEDGPYALEVSPERVVTAAAIGGSASREERLTLSYRGVVRHCDDPDNHELTPLQDFVRECEIFEKIKQIPVFGQYLLWKPLRVWKHAVARQRFVNRRKSVQDQLLLVLVDDHNACIRRILLGCAAKCVGFADEQRAAGVVHKSCEISEFVQAQEQMLGAFAAAKRAAEDNMTAIIRSEAMAGVRCLLARMGTECSVEFAVEGCHLTISEQLARRSSGDRAISARSDGSHPSPSPAPPQAYIVQSILAGEVVAQQQQQQQQQQHQQQQQRQARGDGSRRRRGQSHDFLVKQAQRESQEQYRRGVLAFAERAQLKAFGQQLKRAVRTVDLMWAEAIRSSVVSSLNAVLGRIRSDKHATEVAALKLHVCVARNGAKADVTGTERFAAALVPGRDEFPAPLNAWMARVMDASQHTNTLMSRSELERLLAMSSQPEPDPRELARMEKFQLGSVGELEQLANDIMQTLTAQYSEAAVLSSAQLSHVCAEHGQTEQLEAHVAVDMLSRLSVQQIAEMLDRLERLSVEVASIPQVTRCGCLQLLCHQFVEDLAQSNQTCKEKLQQTLPARFQTRFRTAMAGYQAAQELIAIKPIDPASYVRLIIRFREVSSSRWSVLNDEYEYAVELGELLKERSIVGIDDRTMQLVMLDGAKLALQDRMQVTDNLLETQGQQVVAQLNAESEALAAPIEEVENALNSSELASPEAAPESALTILDLQASRLADLKERIAEIAYSLEVLGEPALDTARMDDCGTLLALLRSAWELRQQITVLLNEFMASAQNSVDLAQCGTVVADAQAQAAHLRAELEARESPHSAVLEAVVNDCASISQLLGVLETLRRADFWDLDARCHSEPPCKYVFANPSLSVKALIELEVPAHVHEIVTRFPLPT